MLKDGYAHREKRLASLKWVLHPQVKNHIVHWRGPCTSSVRFAECWLTSFGAVIVFYLPHRSLGLAFLVGHPWTWVTSKGKQPQG